VVAIVHEPNRIRLTGLSAINSFFSLQSFLGPYWLCPNRARSLLQSFAIFGPIFLWLKVPSAGSRSRFLPGTHLEHFRGDERGFAAVLPVPARVAEAEDRQHGLSAVLRAVSAGRMNDSPGSPVKPFMSLATAVTLTTGALVYHFR